jgi:PAS domain S-box-containing protein
MGEACTDRGSVGGAAPEVVLLRQRITALEQANRELQERLRMLRPEPIEPGERERLEQRLRESEERYRTVVESAGETIAIVDEDGAFLFMNGTAARALGGAPADFVGKTMWDLFPETIADRQASVIRKVIRTGSGANSLVLSCVRDQWRWYNTTIEPLRNSAGKVTAGLVIARDVHELRTAQQELEAHRERMMRAEHLASLGTLSAMCAHELTQPLTVIRLSLQNAIQGLAGTPCPATVLGDLSDGLAEVSAIAAIVERIRGVAQKTSDPTVARVVLAATARRVMSLLEDSARTARIVLEPQLDALPPICAYERNLEQVFFALAQNAVQAADGSKACRLRITGRIEDDTVELRFTDDCGGIAPEHLNRIFEPFFTTKHAGEGTGLGLCVVHRILAQAGGHIRVETRFGEGTTFIVTLPVECG